MLLTQLTLGRKVALMQSRSSFSENPVSGTLCMATLPMRNNSNHLASFHCFHFDFKLTCKKFAASQPNFQRTTDCDAVFLLWH